MNYWRLYNKRITVDETGAILTYVTELGPRQEFIPGVAVQYLNLQDWSADGWFVTDCRSRESEFDLVVPGNEGTLVLIGA